MSIHPGVPRHHVQKRRDADRPLIAAALAPNRVPRPEDVLAVGGRYVHCGQPMERPGPDLRRLNAPVCTDEARRDELDAYLSTQVLRCACGFQMELPG